jgi:hypothetical protein
VLAGGILAGVVPNYFALGKIIDCRKYKNKIIKSSTPSMVSAVSVLDIMYCMKYMSDNDCVTYMI